MNLRVLFPIFIEKRLLRWDSNTLPHGFKAVALTTEPLRQSSSNTHTKTEIDQKTLNSAFHRNNSTDSKYSETKIISSTLRISIVKLDSSILNFF